MFRLFDITIDIIFFSINWKNYFDRSILVISMTVLDDTVIDTSFEFVDIIGIMVPLAGKGVILH